MTSHEKQQYWSQLFVQQAQSDLSITNFCKAHQINIGTYYYWKQKLSDHSSTLRIHPVRVQEYRDLSPHGHRHCVFYLPSPDQHVQQID